MVVGNITLYPKKNKKFALRGQRANFLYIINYLPSPDLHKMPYLSFSKQVFYISKIKSSLCRIPQT